MNDSFNIDYAIVQAFERSKRDETRSGSGRLFVVVLMAVFFIVLMIGLSSGVMMYQKVARAQAQTNDLHMQSGLLVNSIRVDDASNALELGQGPEGEALVMVEHLDSGTFETRIYRYQGSIVQEYAIAERDYNPASALTLVDSDRFEFSYTDGLLTIYTDQGAFDVALRSSQGLTRHVESAGAAEAAAKLAASNTSAEGGA